MYWCKFDCCIDVLMCRCTDVPAWLLQLKYWCPGWCTGCNFKQKIVVLIYQSADLGDVTWQSVELIMLMYWMYDSCAIVQYWMYWCTDRPIPCWGKPYPKWLEEKKYLTEVLDLRCTARRCQWMDVLYWCTDILDVLMSDVLIQFDGFTNATL
jgi:hypothetical protein